eukprot:CAMPEP_0201714512 /NCGR_PEP_ID=MMETSP0593-20130828/964_1 /ASSEMBLY_ACC=CAM_ASM_000672 /TAXON_ID=267983 /ORGANISM="Skeletonema japonicum, Strain CCMP2506" /LENGTH=89 /DNA_ID=CAMNT_0048203799 /DNA_START=117 /DNA_END=386 /DNA_ORIENTATION=-
MNSFRAVHTISRRMMTSGVHQPFAIKPKFKVPKSAGMADMETKLWPINPGLAVTLAGAGAFVAGMGVHVLTRGAPINTEVKKASFGNFE